MTLEEFLLARLWDDECYARNATERAGADWEEIWSGTVETADDLIATNDSQVSRFMEQFDPARVLAEVEAKRELLSLHPSFDYNGHTGCDACSVPGCDFVDYPCDNVKSLVAPYRDHPDFKPRWSI